MSQTETAATKVDVQDAGPCLKKLTITIPAEKIADQLELSLGTVVDEAELPGFRKGRAPRQLVEKRFGGVVKEEAKNQLVASAYSEAIEEKGLKVLGDPEGADELKDLELDPSQDVTFTVEVEVAPEFDLPSLEGIEIKRPTIEIEDEHVDKQLAKICQSEGELESQDQAAPGDYCIGRGVMKLADTDEAVLDLEGAVIQVPTGDDGKKGMILGVMVEDFADQVGSPKPGEQFVVKTKGPAQHEDPRVRDADITIEFDVERVERIQPAPIDKIVERSGLADEAQLRESIKLRLTQQANVEQQSAMRRQVAKHLLDQIEFQLPEKLTHRQAERNIQRARFDMQHRGLDDMQVEQRIAELRDTSDERAANELKLFFVLAKAAEDFNIEVTQDEISGRIAAIAAQRRMAPQDLANQLVQQNQIGFIAQQIREHKVMDRLVEQAKIEDVSVEDFNKSMTDDADTVEVG
ncbi:MAG: trigger factor [Phycisphaerales bacterium]